MVTQRLDSSSSPDQLLTQATGLRRMVDANSAALAEVQRQILNWSQGAEATATLEAVYEFSGAWLDYLKEVRPLLKSLRSLPEVVELLQSHLIAQQTHLNVMRELLRELRLLHQPDLPLQ